MCIVPDKMIYRSSPSSTIINFFRASLLFVALLSTFSLHFSSVVSSFLFLNIVFACKKMTSRSEYERMVNKVPQQEAASSKTMMQNAGSKVLDRSHFTISNLFEPDSVSLDEKFEFGAGSNKSDSNTTLSLYDEFSLEDSEEEYMIEIEIPVSEKDVGLRGKTRLNLEADLQREGLDEDTSDVGGEEDNLIEIDISVGSIRNSVSGCENEITG